MADKIIKTPRGIARWPFLNKPYTQFKAEGEYKVTLELNAGDDGVAEFVERCDAVITKKKLKNSPYKAEDGKYSFKFASKYPPQIFDSHGVKVAGDMHMGSGSVIVCAIEPAIYDGFGGGIKFYLKAVQVLEFVEYSGSTADDYGFTAEEGGFTAPSFDALGDDKPDDAKKVEDKGFDW